MEQNKQKKKSAPPTPKHRKLYKCRDLCLHTQESHENMQRTSKDQQRTMQKAPTQHYRDKDPPKTLLSLLCVGIAGHETYP